MLREVPKEQKKFDINSELLSEITWEGMSCLENTWRTNRYAKSVDMMMSWAKIKIVCLVSQLTMIKIMSNPEDNGSFSMKSIEMEFHGRSEIESCLRDP